MSLGKTVLVLGDGIGGTVAAARLGKALPDKAPLEILRERYARGEIDREEYEQKRRDLGPPA